MAKDNAINLIGMTQFKLKQGESLTIPALVTSASPANASSGVYPTTTFDAKRPVVGGFVFAGFSDAAGPTAVELSLRLQAGDVLACSAVASNVVTISINSVAVATITGVTTVAGVVGAYG